MKKLLLALLAALTLAPAAAQQFPATMPANTVYGRLGVTPGPGQPVPVTSLLSAATQSPANQVFAGPTSGGTGAMAPRSLIFADFPQMTAGTLLGNPTGGTAIPQAIQIQNLANLSVPDSALDYLLIWDHTTGQLKYISPSQMPGLASPLAQNNLWTGTNDFQASYTTFGGSPWFDVKSAGHGCAAAVGNNSVDDTVAIQCHINYVDNTFAGGTVFFSPGNYKVTAGLTVAQATCLVGVNGSSPTGVSAITGVGDITVITFAANKSGACLRGLSIFGYMNSAATNPTVLVANNSAVHMHDCVIWGGVFALRTAGVDGRIDNCGISGWGTSGGNIDSTGANFYSNDKFDQGLVTVAFGFHQGVCLGSLCENHFTDTDFSGSFSVASFNSDDGGTGRNINVIIGGIFSNAVVLTSSKFTTLVGAEFGGAVSAASGPLSITGSYSFSAISATGAAPRSCAGNINITC